MYLSSTLHRPSLRDTWARHEQVVDEAKTDETLRIELADELEQLKQDQKNLVVIFAARGPEEGATPIAQVSERVVTLFEAS